MNLTDHFHLEELIASQTAVRSKIDNTPPEYIIDRLRETAVQMELVRMMLGNEPITVSSGYRSPDLNTAIGGSKTSAHCDGYAVDFIAPRAGTPLQICRKLIAKGLKFDQLIEEGTWVHVSFDPRMRGQVLTMRDGRYTPGLSHA